MVIDAGEVSVPEEVVTMRGERRRKMVVDDGEGIPAQADVILINGNRNVNHNSWGVSARC